MIIRPSIFALLAGFLFLLAGTAHGAGKLWDNITQTVQDKVAQGLTLHGDEFANLRIDVPQQKLTRNVIGEGQSWVHWRATGDGYDVRGKIRVDGEMGLVSLTDRSANAMPGTMKITWYNEKAKPIIKRARDREKVRDEQKPRIKRVFKDAAREALEKTIGVALEVRSPSIVDGDLKFGSFESKNVFKPKRGRRKGVKYVAHAAGRVNFIWDGTNLTTLKAGKVDVSVRRSFGSWLLRRPRWSPRKVSRSK